MVKNFSQELQDKLSRSRNADTAKDAISFAVQSINNGIRNSGDSEGLAGLAENLGRLNSVDNLDLKIIKALKAAFNGEWRSW